MKKTYCGAKPLTKKQKRGTQKECKDKRQIRYWGVEKVDKELLKMKKPKLKKIVKQELDKIKLELPEIDNIGIDTMEKYKNIMNNPLKKKLVDYDIDDRVDKRLIISQFPHLDSKTLKKMKDKEYVLNLLKKEHRKRAPGNISGNIMRRLKKEAQYMSDMAQKVKKSPIKNNKKSQIKKIDKKLLKLTKPELKKLVIPELKDIGLSTRQDYEKIQKIKLPKNLEKNLEETRDQIFKRLKKEYKVKGIDLDEHFGKTLIDDEIKKQEKIRRKKLGLFTQEEKIEEIEDKIDSLEYEIELIEAGDMDEDYDDEDYKQDDIDDKKEKIEKLKDKIGKIKTSIKKGKGKHCNCKKCKCGGLIGGEAINMGTLKYGGKYQQLQHPFNEVPFNQIPSPYKRQGLDYKYWYNI